MRSNACMKDTDDLLGRAAFGILRGHDALRRSFNPRFRQRQESVVAGDVKVIAAVKLCCLGDAILAVPALRALKQRWPQARLVILCTPRSSPAFAGLGFVDEAICIPVTGLEGVGQLLHSTPRAINAIAAIRRQQPDIAVDLDLYYKATPVISYLSGAPVRVGFDTEGYRRAGLFTAAIQRDRNKWEAECFLDLVGAVGADSRDLTLEYHIPEEAERAAAQILRAHGIGPQDAFVALCPGSSKNWPVKQWPPARFAEVANRVSRDRGMAVVAVGASFEKGLCEEVASLSDVEVANLAGETSMAETAAVLRAASTLVTNDTGPMHLASAVGTPVVAIFGPTNEKKWGPRGSRDIVIYNEDCDCRPCYYLSWMPDCDDRRCLTEIPAQRVLAALDQVLGAK